MATYYSDHFTPTGVSQTSATRDHRTQSKRQTVKKDIVNVTALALTTDVVRFTTLPSGARIVDLRITGGDEADAGALDIGLHKSERHGGAVIDKDLFADAVAKDAARVDAFDEAGTLDDQDRGKHLWELANIGAGTYTEDPQEEWDITGTPSTSFTTTANSFTLEIDYIEP